MPVLSAKFKLIDEMSARLAAISDSGERMTSRWEETRSSAENAISAMETSASSVADRISGVAASMTEATQKTDYWANAVGNYSQSALEAIYSTEELVDMGLKSAEALTEQQEMMSLLDKSASNLSSAIEATTEAENGLASVLKEYDEQAEKIENSDKVSAETKQKLAEAYSNATAAQNELTAAQQEATAAMEAYEEATSNSVITNEELEAAAERVGQASEKLAEANGNATKATEELAGANNKAGKEADEGGKKGVEAIQEVEAALASAGIIKTVSDITEGVYELATAFSEAESTIVKATGASDTALKSLDASMMNAFSQSKTGSMEDTAAAVGEINTRMGLFGDELTEVTGKFLDFSSITNTDVVSSVQGVTKVMNRWNVEGKNVESVLDRLSYAGQISGASVSTLTSTLQTGAPTFQQFDLSLDNAISMLADFELAGINSSSVIMGLRNAAKNFADEGLNAHDALIDTIKQLETTENQAEATALAVDTFGSRAGLELASAIRNGQLSVETFTASLDEADGVLEKTAENAQTLDQKWEQATNNIKTAFTQAVEPTINKVSETLAAGVNGIGNFLKEHETLTKILTAVGVGLGVVVAGIAGITFVTKVAIPLITSLAGSLSMAQFAALGLAGAAVAVISFIALANDGTSAYEEQTRALEELGSEIDNLESRHNELGGSYEKTNAEINEQYDSSQRLIDRLKALDSTAEKTAGTEAEMKAIVDRLNEAYPQLGLTLEGVSGNLDEVIAKFEAAAGAESKVAKYENAKSHYTELLAEQKELEKAFDEASSILGAANAEFSKYNMGDAFIETFGGTSDKRKVFNEATKQYERALKLLEENRRQVNECKSAMEEYGDLVNGTSQEQVSAYDAVYIALEKTKDASTELIGKYNEAYQSAYDSISGQIGLFDQMAISCETSTDQMIAALKSQSDYIATYTDNLKLAAEIGLSEGLLAKLSDGSEESAGYLDAIISKVDELGGTTEEAKAFIEEMNGSFSEVETAKKEFSNTVAEMQTDFSSKMEEISASMEKTISDMKMDEEAARAAKETLDAYVNMIESYKGKAGEAAAAVANATNAALGYALSGGVPTIPTYDDVAGSSTYAYDEYANGTTNTPDVFIAGEEGPELILGKPNSTVFPTDETDRIIRAVNDREFNITPAEYAVQAGGKDVSPQSFEKKITLEIAGSGTIGVKGGMSKESVLEILTENIKPALLEIIETEIIEEGDQVYDY